MARSLALLLLALMEALPVVAHASECPAIPNSWDGQLVVGEVRLPLRLAVNHGADCQMELLLESVAQGAKIPGAGTWSGKRLVLNFPQIQARFEGTYSQDQRQIEGQWTQLGHSSPLVFHADSKPPSQTKALGQEQSMPTPFEGWISQENVTVRNGTGAALSGVVLRPVNTTQALPAVIIAGGIGTQPKIGDVAGKPIYADIASAIVREQIAVYLFDVRGVGGSTGDYWASTFQQLTEDVCAVVKHARSSPAVAPGNVVLIGHSSGGVAAAACASEVAGIKGVLLLAPPGKSGAGVALDQIRAGLQNSPISQDEKSRFESLHEHLFDAIHDPGLSGGDLLAKLNGIVDKELGAGLIDEASKAMLHEARRALPGLAQPAMTSYLRLDPRPVYAAIPPSVSLAIMYGEKDQQVPASKNLHLVEAALGARPHPTSTTLLPEHNHIFQFTAGSGGVGDYYIQSGVSEIAAEQIAKAVKDLIGDR